MKSESKLAPCPFCGCGAAISQTSNGWWEAHCMNALCPADHFKGAQLEASTTTGATILWNDNALKQKEKNGTHLRQVYA